MRIKSEYKKIYGYLLVFNFIYVLPIIIVNRYYNDDLSRALTGATGWNGDGRPLTQMLLQLLGGGTKKAVDIAPLPLITGIVVLSFSLVVYLQNILRSKMDSFLSAVTLFLFSINPFMIYAFSYKYDAISMIFSLTLIIILFSDVLQIDDLNVGKKTIIWIIVSVFVGIVVMMLYQPGIGLVIGMFFISVALYLLGRRAVDDLIIDFLKLVGSGIGTIIYKLFIVDHYIIESSDDWRYEASKLVAGGNSWIKNILINLYNMLLYIYRFYKNNLSRLFLASIAITIAIIHITVVCKVFVDKKKNSKRSALISACVILLLPIIITIGTCLPLAFLNDMSCRGRLFLAFSAVFLFLGVEISELLEYKSKFFVICLVPLILFAFSFMYAYGNASYSQKEYETYLVQSIGYDISELAGEDDSLINENGYMTISFLNNTPRSNENELLTEIYPAFEELVPTYLNNSSWLGGALLKRYIKTPIKFDASINVENIETIKPVRKHLIYDVYVCNEAVVIQFD